MEKIAEGLTEEQKQYVRKITNLAKGEEFKIAKEHYTEEMHAYLEKHKKRVKKD